MFLVPVDSKESILEHLETIRFNTKRKDPLFLKKIKRISGPLFRTAKAWVNFGVGTLIQKNTGKPFHLLTGKKTRTTEYDILKEAIGAKFILFRERTNHQDMTGYSDYAAKEETTMRMGIKGGLHSLFSPESPVEITALHFDGFEHRKRKIDAERVIGRMNGLRNYAVLPAGIPIHEGSSDHRVKNAQNYDDCQLLQLTDLLVGSFRACLSKMVSKTAHLQMAYPVKQIIKRYERGPSGWIRNSRWNKGFCMSECYIQNGVWEFENFIFKQINENQLSLL